MSATVAIGQVTMEQVFDAMRKQPGRYTTQLTPIAGKPGALSVKLLDQSEAEDRQVNLDELSDALKEAFPKGRGFEKQTLYKNTRRLERLGGEKIGRQWTFDLAKAVRRVREGF